MVITINNMAQADVSFNNEERKLIGALTEYGRKVLGLQIADLVNAAWEIKWFLTGHEYIARLIEEGKQNG